MIRKYATAVIAGLLCSVVIIVACMTTADLMHTKATAGQEETKATHYTYKVVEVESATEETTEPSTEIVESVPERIHFNVDLPEYLQDYIFDECERVGISPAVVVAIIERESNFDEYAIGDDGRSFGLMQIQPKWHIERMIALGCTDLFNPYENITVGIDYLVELYNRYGDINKALVAYNRGSYNGTITKYASDVMARAEEMRAM